MAKNCHSSFTGGPPGGGILASANAQTNSTQGGGASAQSSKGSSKGYFVGFTWKDQSVPDTFVEIKAMRTILVEASSAAYFVTSPEVAIVDTGAVNGIVGVTQFEILCKQLARVGLAAHIDPSAAGAPKNVGGIGGGAAVVCTAVVPTALDSIPGLISFIVIAGEVPALLPLPLMKALGAVLDMPGQTIWWQEHAGHASTLMELPTGHVGCSILEGIDKWASLHPCAQDYRRVEKEADAALDWVRHRAKELLVVKNGRKADHYLFEASSDRRSCLTSRPSSLQHGLVGASSQERTMSEEGGDRVCHSSRSKCCGVVGETHAENDTSALHSQSPGDPVGAEDPRDGSTR
eukprot:5397502-Amphidinium_carterae.1